MDLGPIGLILATPLTLCLVVLGRHVERLEFLDVILGDRAPLTPVENFYQRLLAGDPDEALDQAELLLKERSLSSYYDEVALAGLRLAATDVRRGVLTPFQLERICKSVNELVAGLEDHLDSDPITSDSAQDVAGSTAAEKRLPIEPAPDLPAPAEEDVRSFRSSASGRGDRWTGPLPAYSCNSCKSMASRLAFSPATPFARTRDGDRHGERRPERRHGVPHLSDDCGEPVAVAFLVRRIRGYLPKASILSGFWPADSQVPLGED